MARNRPEPTDPTAIVIAKDRRGSYVFQKKNGGKWGPLDSQHGAMYWGYLFDEYDEVTVYMPAPLEEEQ